MGTHIDNIEIKNFKSIRHQTIEGCKRINVFIGYPNVGKSNILEALSLFSLPYLKIAGSKKLTDFIRVNNLPGLFYGTDTNTPIQININSDLQFKGIYDKNAVYPLECVYSKKEHVASKMFDATVILPYESALKPRILFDNNLNVKFVNLPNRIGGFWHNEILKYHFSMENFKPKKVLFPALIPPFGNNLFEIVNSKSELRDFLKEEFEKVNGKYIYDTETGMGKMLKVFNENTFTLPFNAMADTLQRLLFFSAAIISNNDSVLLFEEPEVHMFPPYIRKFNGEIIYEKANNNQYFIVTHSPDVLDDIMYDAQEDLSIYLVGYKNGETNIKRLSDEEMVEVRDYHVDLFFNIESYLD